MIDRNNISFNESLDTVRQYSDDNLEEKRVELIIKMGALFSEQIILSDTQFVDNKGVRNLFLNRLGEKGFQDFFSETIMVGIRPGFSSFSELVDQQIKKRMIFSSFPSKPRKAIVNGDIKNIYALNTLYPNLRFKPYIEALDKIYEDLNTIDIKYDPKSFPDLVEKNLENTKELDAHAKRLCEELMSRTKDELKLKMEENPGRSDFYNAIDKSPYNPKSKEMVKRFFVDSAYNKNFWYANKFNALNHPGENDANLFASAYPNIVKEFESSKDIIKLPTIPSEVKINLNEIDFNFLHTLHTDNKKEIEKLSLIRTAKNVESADEKLENYINFLTQEVKDLYMKKGLKKLIKPIKIIAHASLGLSYLGTKMNYITPEISFCIPATSYFVLSITDLIDEYVILPRQNKRFTVIEKYLKETKLVD